MAARRRGDQQKGSDVMSRQLGRKVRVVALGGGFRGIALMRRLEKLLRRRADVEFTLISRDNAFVLTPLLFEACSGRVFRPDTTRIDLRVERAQVGQTRVSVESATGRSSIPA